MLLQQAKELIDNYEISFGAKSDKLILPMMPYSVFRNTREISDYVCVRRSDTYSVYKNRWTGEYISTTK
jgi:hypothetical protein